MSDEPPQFAPVEDKPDNSFWELVDVVLLFGGGALLLVYCGVTVYEILIGHMRETTACVIGALIYGGWAVPAFFRLRKSSRLRKTQEAEDHSRRDWKGDPIE